MTKLSFWGNIQVFAGKEKINENICKNSIVHCTEFQQICDCTISWLIHDQETLTSMLRTALLNATRGDLITVVPFTLKQIDFSNYNENDNTYYVKCLVEVDENDYQMETPHYQDLRDFYVIGIPTFDYQIEENCEPERMCGEFWLKIE